MLQQLVMLLPVQVARCSAETSGAVASLGAVLWLVGGRFSRSIIALAAVALGAMIGLRLPAWRGWAIDGMGLAVGGAVVLGAAAYLFHRTCIGLLLGIAMMTWAGAGVWLALAGDAGWDLSGVHWNGDMVQLLRDAWKTLPPGVAHAFPIACLSGLGAGITIAAWFPKAGKVLAHAITGVTLMVTMGMAALLQTKPQVLAGIGGSDAAQGGALIALVLLGTACQWWITPPHRDRVSKGGGDA